MSQSLLPHIEPITSEAKRCKLDFGKMSGVENEVKSISEFFDISRVQTIIFSCLLEFSFHRTVTFDFFALNADCSIIHIINLTNEFESLEKKRLIKKVCKENGRQLLFHDIGYSVPYNVIESLRLNNRQLINDCAKMNLPLLVEKVAEMIEERSNSSSSTKEMLEQVEFLLAINKDNPFINFINSNIKNTTNKCLVLSLSLLSFRRREVNSLEGITSSIFDNLSEQLEYEQNLLARNNELTRNGIIRFVESEFMDEKVPMLTDKTIKLLYADYPELKVELEVDGVIRSNKIAAKKLFYDSNLSGQIKKLIRTISQNHYEVVQSKLTQNGLPTGITAMFYGSSGTGKTESIYQIARITGRDIMMVDLSQLKSKWFGDSEKRVKKIFDDYNRLCNNYTIKPILFINEADGMFTKRLTNGISSADQAVNTMQNIILQALENFEGILLATTNLSANLDSALERRFLFKIEFKNPHPNTSQRIWKSKIPELKPSYIKLLSVRYQLSGGEIENVARKYFMDKIINDKRVGIEQIISYCEEEKPFQKQRKIGF